MGPLFDLGQKNLIEICSTWTKIFPLPPSRLQWWANTVHARVGPEGWGPEGWEPNPRKGGAPKGGGAQNFAFFFPSPATIFFLSSLCWGSSRGILVFLKRRGRQMCMFSGCRVKPRRPPSRRGFTQQPENSKCAHFRDPALQTPPKFHERTPKREKERKLWRERKKKKAKFWAVRRRGGPVEGRSRGGGVPGRGGEHPNLEPTHRHTHRTHTADTHTQQTHTHSRHTHTHSRHTHTADTHTHTQQTHTQQTHKIDYLGQLA